MEKSSVEKPSRIHVDDIVIRSARISDCDVIGDLWEQLVLFHRELDESLPIAVEDGGKLYADRIIDRLNDTQTRVLVADYNGRVVGFVLGVIIDLVPEMFIQQTGGFLADIYVHDDYRRRGIGQKLVNELLEWYRSKGVSYLELYVATKNNNAREFWDAIGGRDIMNRKRIQL